LSVSKKDKFQSLKIFLRTFLLFISLVLLVGFKCSYPFYQINENNQERLSEVLKKTGEYCKKVKRMALFYVCKENVVGKIYFYRKKDIIKRFEKLETDSGQKNKELKEKRKKTFTYDYQLVKKEEELREKRVLLEEDGKEKYEENAVLWVVKYVGKYLVFGPVGFLSKYWQNYFNYEIVGKDTVEGKDAIIIKSSPKEIREENNNFGKIWVDEKDFSILKIEWDPLSIKDFVGEKIQTPGGDLRETVTWNVIYGVEKNGVRFPSKQLIQEVFVNEKGQKVIKEETIIIYKDYQFFIVEVDVKYKR